MGLADADPTRGYLIHSPTAWKEVAIVMAMQGNVEHTGVLVEGLLRAVAMVNVLHRVTGSGLGKVSRSRDGDQDTLEGFKSGNHSACQDPRLRLRKLGFLQHCG
jgi:hypothetical protein